MTLNLIDVDEQLMTMFVFDKSNYQVNEKQIAMLMEPLNLYLWLMLNQEDNEKKMDEYHSRRVKRNESDHKSKSMLILLMMLSK